MDKDEDILRVPLHMSALPFIEDVCAHAISTKLSRVFLAHQIGFSVVFSNVREFYLSHIPVAYQPLGMIKNANKPHIGRTMVARRFVASL